MTDKENDIQKEEKGIAFFETFEVIDREIYAQLLWKNIIVKINSNKNKVEIISLDDRYRFKQCVAEKNIIYFADNLGEVLVSLDIKSKKQKLYHLGFHEQEDNNIATVESFDGNIFCVSAYKGLISILDTKSETVELDDSLSQIIDRDYKETIKYVNCWRADNVLYFRLVLEKEDTSEWFQYDLSEKYLKKIDKDIFPNKMVDAYYYDKRLYILQDDFNLVIWDIEENVINKIFLKDIYQMCDSNSSKGIWSTLVVTDKNIWIFPLENCEDICIYDKTDNTTKIYKEYPQDFRYLHLAGWAKYAKTKERAGSVYVSSRLSNYFLIIDIKTGEGVWKASNLSGFREYYISFINRINQAQEKTLYEQNIPLSIYLDYLQKDTKNVAKSENIGEEIWRKFV